MSLLEGTRAIVTGAGNGIGRETAKVCAREGARVGVLDVDAEAAARTVGEVEAAGGEAIALVADLTDEAAVEGAVAAAVSAFGGLDSVLGCAGVQLAGQDDRADRLSLDVWRRTIDINLTGMFLIAKHGIRALLDGGGGTVVLVCSPTGLFGCAPGYDAYSTSKAGVYGLVRVLAADYAQDGIRVNGVVPGYTITPMTEWVSPDEHAALLETIPLRRAGQPEEVAEVMAFLASDRTPYTTGAVWSADGGMTAI
ncbi:MAG TPA: SDR family NAD(P)-dependent oxidoreductase [Gaiellaceae bacterium]|nr:SDR family NAD(P)-dependent oxidoreductase [Gaiellaceae bacterium]